jgi:AcrR family transcriptional regulator
MLASFEIGFHRLLNSADDDILRRAMSTPPIRRGRRSGRRPGESGTREAILAAARRHFADEGYGHASLRAIAATAGVDQKLIAHYFGSKQQLFLAVIGLPINPAEVMDRVLADGGDPAAATARLVDELTAILERPELVQSIAALIRAGATEPEVARLLRQFFPGALIDSVRGRLGPGDPAFRLNLVGSQIIGLVMARAVVGLEPLASMSPRAVAESVAPGLVRYLIGPLAPHGEG